MQAVQTRKLEDAEFAMHTPPWVRQGTVHAVEADIDVLVKRCGEDIVISDLASCHAVVGNMAGCYMRVQFALVEKLAHTAESDCMAGILEEKVEVATWAELTYAAKGSELGVAVVGRLAKVREGCIAVGTAGEARSLV
jgi:hypothetical protein